MKENFKVFSWCGGDGIDCKIDEIIRSRVIWQEEGRIGENSCSLVGWNRTEEMRSRLYLGGQFIEVMIEESVFEYSRNVYELITKFD